MVRRALRGPLRVSHRAPLLPRRDHLRRGRIVPTYLTLSLRYTSIPSRRNSLGVAATATVPGGFSNHPGSSVPRTLSRTLTRVNIPDRKSTRLNSSHVAISYAVFCLKKKNTNYNQ